LLQVTKERARRSQSTPEALAQQWCRNLQQTFAQPYLAVEHPKVTVPLGETVEVPVFGQPEGILFLPIGPYRTCQPDLSEDGRRLRLTGTAVGEEEIVLRRGRASLGLCVWVRKYAGRFLKPLRALVTGQATPASTLWEAVYQAIWNAVTLEPGARLQVTRPQGIPALRRGQKAWLPVSLRLAGEGYLPVEGEYEVELVNLDWPRYQAQHLIVSNDPEPFSRPGLLCYAPLTGQEMTRLLYHHKNVASRPLGLEVLLLNPSEESVQVHLRHSAFGPAKDEIYLGHRAMADFFRQKWSNNGYLLELAPQSAWRLWGRRVGPQHVVSGLAEIMPLTSQTLYVQIRATSVTREAGPVAWPQLAGEPTLDHLFPRPHRRLQVTYTPGGPFGFITVGEDPLYSLTRRPLLGNYGVLYEVSLRLVNPTARMAPLEIVFSADGGAARGVLLMNGEFFETGFVPAGEEERLCKLHLRPYEERYVLIYTMPQAGSSYPLRVVARPYRYASAGDKSYYLIPPLRQERRQKKPLGQVGSPGQTD